MIGFLFYGVEPLCLHRAGFRWGRHAYVLQKFPWEILLSEGEWRCRGVELPLPALNQQPRSLVIPSEKSNLPFHQGHNVRFINGLPSRVFGIGPQIITDLLEEPIGSLHYCSDGIFVQL